MIEVARIHKVDNGSALKAFADVIINGQVLIKGVRVVEGENGLFVAMPRQQGKDNKWYETVSLLDEEVKQELQNTILEAYNAE
jgi:stage V sporulation protein G